MWCPQHRLEFFNPSFTTCPSCGSPLVDQLPPDAEPDPLPQSSEMPATEGSVTATRLGGFDLLAAPMLLDLLAERGIRAFEAQQLANAATRGLDPMKTDVWVESGRLEDARQVADEELPVLLEQSVSDDLEPEPEGDGEEDAEGDAIGWQAFGWLETHVAIVFVQVCEEEAISARAEYPLDRPPPVWVTPGMRVQVYVDEFFVGEAEQLLERVEQRLDEQGISWEEPLCELSGP